MMSYPRRKKQKIPWRVPVRGTLFAILAAVVLILLLTLFVYLGWFGESAIPIGNTVIKALAAAVAGLVVGRHRIRAVWWYGAIAAAAAVLVLWAGMSLYLGEWNLSWGLFADLLMSVAIGGAIAALLLRRKPA
ncbi:MAG: TIGR04086 family membrane protein [Clostridia bacterium]|nr:TIGR04086 family membrane protein [Clostridia bacterium]MBR3130401.1 TIGR04086 family membrane protein [Clostridia bacterium]